VAAVARTVLKVWTTKEKYLGRAVEPAPSFYQLVKIFIGNLGQGMDHDTVLSLCERFGSVLSVELSLETDGNRSGRFAFVTMPDSQQAISAIVALNNASMNGRNLIVNEARPVANGSGKQHHRFIRH
jgi:RNA recognition motif-containing protein